MRARGDRPGQGVTEEARAGIGGFSAVRRLRVRKLVAPGNWRDPGREMRGPAPFPAPGGRVSAAILRVTPRGQGPCVSALPHFRDLVLNFLLN